MPNKIIKTTGITTIQEIKINSTNIKTNKIATKTTLITTIHWLKTTNIDTTKINIIPKTTIITTIPKISIITTIPESTIISSQPDFSLASTISQTTDFPTLPETTIDSSSNPISSPNLFLLGFDNYIFYINIKKATFNLYFIFFNDFSFNHIIYIYLNINYIKFRNLSELTKGKCNFIKSNITDQIQYECEFFTNGTKYRKC